MHARRFILAAAFFAGAESVRAIPLDKPLSQLSHDIWQVEHGLPQNSIRAVAQGSDGYLWLGTSDGLVRFDGVRFTVFDRHNTPALEENTVQVLYTASNGVLWIGTRAGGVVAMRDGVFTREIGIGRLSSHRVLAISRDRAGAMWMGTSGNGLIRLKDGSATTFTTRDGLSNDRVTAVAEDRTGDLWIGHADGGVTKRHAERFVPFDDPLVRGRSVLTLLAARDGTVWIGTNAGLLRFSDGRLQRFAPALLQATPVLALFEDRDGTIWVGSRGDGLGAIRHGRFDRYRVADGLSNDVVTALALDREGSLWVGTDGGGLNRLRDTSVSNVGVQEGLPRDVALAVYQDHAGTLWVGTSGGGLARIEHGTATTLRTDPALARAVVNAIEEEPAGGLWVGTGTAGLFRLEGTRVAERWTTANGLPQNTVYTVLSRAPGDVWAGTRSGIMRTNAGPSATPRTFLSDQSVRVLTRARDGGVWIGTNGGGLLHWANEVVSSPIPTTGLGRYVRAVLEDPDGTVWIGTNGAGLLRARGAKVVAFTARNGLPDDVVHQILDDGQGYLWLSSNHGVSRVKRAALNAANEETPLGPVNFGRSDGMRSSECRGGFQPAGVRTADGRMWFPTTRGVAVIDARRFLRSGSPPPVLVEEAMVDQRAVNPRQFTALPAGNGSLEFHYTALNLSEAARDSFQYRLEGFDRDWVEAGTRRVAFYTNIAPGRYTFRVRARNGFDVWSTRDGTFTFALTPPFYRTLSFYALSVAGLLSALLTTYRVRVSRTKARELELMRLVEERTRQLRLANDELERLSNQDALTGVANRRHFDTVFDVEWRRARRSAAPVALLLIDIDAFKAYNDALGHLAGDACLAQTAGALAGGVHRATDLVARYGGEEFVVLMPGVPLEDAVKVGERLRGAVEALAIPHPASPAGPLVTISIGAASLASPVGTDAASLVAAADQALYEAKRGGRNRVHAASEQRGA